MNAQQIRALAEHIEEHGIDSIVVARDISIARSSTNKRVRAALSFLENTIVDMDRQFRFIEIGRVDHDDSHVNVRNKLIETAHVAYAACKYRRSTSKWAGGDHKVTIITNGYAWASGGSIHIRSVNRKWLGTNSFHKIFLGSNYMLAVRLGLTIIEIKNNKCLVIDIKQNDRELLVTYVCQERGFAIGTKKTTIYTHDGDCASYPDLARSCGCSRGVSY